MDYSKLKKDLLSQHILLNAKEDDMRELYHYLEERVEAYEGMMELIRKRLKELRREDIEKRGG